MKICEPSRPAQCGHATHTTANKSTKAFHQNSLLPPLLFSIVVNSGSAGVCRASGPHSFSPLFFFLSYLILCHFPGDEWHSDSRLKSRDLRPDRIRWDGGPIMRTRLILAEGANHAQINPPSTHSRCVHLECDEVEVGPRGTSGSAAPACQQTKVNMHQSARWRCPRLPQAACR